MFKFSPADLAIATLAFVLAGVILYAWAAKQSRDFDRRFPPKRLSPGE